MAQIKPDFYQLKYLDFLIRQNAGNCPKAIKSRVLRKRRRHGKHSLQSRRSFGSTHASESLRKSAVGGYGKQGSLWPRVQAVSVKGRACFQIVSRGFSAVMHHVKNHPFWKEKKRPCWVTEIVNGSELRTMRHAIVSDKSNFPPFSLVMVTWSCRWTDR